VAEYLIQTSQPGGVANFRLDFGDGTFTVSALQGTHTYALNATIDPIVTISNDQCQMIQSPVTRDNPQEPPEVVTQVFDFPVPEIPPIPDFTVVPCTLPEPEFNIPPIVTPCVSLTGGGGFPSVIIGPDINMVSQVEIIGPTNPINFPNSVVTIEGGFSLPSHIFVDMPPTIVIDPPIPPTIVVIASGVQSLATSVMNLNWGDMPNLKVDWSDMPTQTVQMQMVSAKPVQSKSLNALSVQNEFGNEFADLFHADNHMTVEYEQMDFPTSINLVVPDIPDIGINADNIPKTIEIQLEEAKLPEVFRTGIFRLESDLPSELTLRHNLPEHMELITSDDFPRQLELVPSDDLPRQIELVMVKPFPTSIQVEGMIDVITVTGLEPFMNGLKLLPPDTMPQVEMVYNGPPLEVKLTMDRIIGTDENGNKNCMMLVPCTP
jgi:hypothetical protein